MATTTEIGAYLIRLLVGSGLPGAPTLHITGVVNAPTGAISAHAEITQAVNAPPIEIPALSGRVESFGAEKVAYLRGQFVYSVPPPAIGSFLAEIDVLLKVDNAWNGVGSFSYLGHHIRNVKVTSETKIQSTN
jgi:hypothetical protein